MADISTVSRTVQFGLEVTPGSTVAADTVLSTVGLSRFKGQGAGETYTPMGSKLATANIPIGREWVEIDFDGIHTYDEVNYIFESALDLVGAPTAAGTNGKQRVYTLSKLTNTKQAYTIEQVHTERTQRASFCQVSDLTLNFGWQAADSKISGKFLGQRIADDVTPTGSPSLVNFNIVSPQTWDVFNAATQAGLDAASGYGRAFKASLAVPNIVGPLNRMASGDVSYVALLEKQLQLAFKLSTGSDDADMSFLSNLRTGDITFFRLESLGPVIAGAVASQYTYQVDVACRVNKPYTPTEEQGVAEGADWEFDLTYDVTWGNILSITTISELASL